MRYPLTIAPVLIVLAALVCTCGTAGNTGLYASPVFLPQVQSVILPAGPLADGDTVQFAVDWLHGREPFTVTWNFGEGVSPTTISTTTPDRSHTVDVTLVNEDAEPATFDGIATVIDFAGESSSATFSYTVDPSP